MSASIVIRKQKILEQRRPMKILIYNTKGGGVGRFSPSIYRDCYAEPKSITSITFEAKLLLYGIAKYNRA